MKYILLSLMLVSLSACSSTVYPKDWQECVDNCGDRGIDHLFIVPGGTNNCDCKDGAVYHLTGR